MDNDFLKNIPVTTLLLIYLFICGGLYLIGFWSTFDIDVFSFISIYDIPKNFAFPLLVSQGFFVLYSVTGITVDLNDDREDRSHFILIKPEWNAFKRLLLGFITLIHLWVILIIYMMIIYLPDYKNNELFWSVTSLIIAYYLLHQFINLNTVKSKIKANLLRYFVGHFLIFFPISCFSTGKIISLRIFHNIENKYVNIINIKNVSAITDTTRIKLLGFISDRIIYSTLDNKKTYILNKESCDGILLTK